MDGEEAFAKLLQEFQFEIAGRVRAEAENEQLRRRIAVLESELARLRTAKASA